MGRNEAWLNDLNTGVLGSTTLTIRVLLSAKRNGSYFSTLYFSTFKLATRPIGEAASPPSPHHSAHPSPFLFRSPSPPHLLPLRPFNPSSPSSPSAASTTPLISVLSSPLLPPLSLPQAKSEPHLHLPPPVPPPSTSPPRTARSAAARRT